jgi:glutathione peroxidase
MTNAHDFSLETIDSRQKPLSEYAGKALLIVNVASKCGLTPQYAGLEELHRKLGPKGLAVLGVPCNQFGGQEPGTEAEIAAFCSKNYGVTFDLFSKIDVKGAGAHPLYQWLTAESGGPVQWNFAKFLIAKDGSLAKRFEPTTPPDDEELLGAIDGALSAPS